MVEIAASFNLALNLALKLAFFAYVGQCVRLPLLNFLTVPILVWLPIDLLRLVAGPSLRLDHGFFNPYYQDWLLIENGYTLFQLLLAVLVFRFAFARSRLGSSLLGAVSPNYAAIAGMALGALCILCFIVTASLGYGVVNWLSDPRTGYQFHREGVGPFYALMVSTACIGCFFALVAAKRPKTLLLSFLLFLPLFYLTGSKGVILRMLVAAVTIYLFKFRRIPLSILVLGGSAGAGLVLVNFGTADILDIFRYFDYYSNSTLIYEAIINNKLQWFGGEISLSELWAIVPRGLYPEKPFVYGQVILSDLLYPGIAESGHTVAFGGPIAAYADFGVLGVVLSAAIDPTFYLGVLLIALLARSYVELGPDEALARPELALIIMLLFVPDALVFFAFPLNVILFLAVSLLVTAAARLEIKVAWPRVAKPAN